MMDTYKLIATELFGVAYDEVTPDQRKTAKAYAYLQQWEAHPETLRKLLGDL